MKIWVFWSLDYSVIMRSLQPIPLVAVFFTNQHLILHIFVDINVKPIFKCLKNWKDK